MSLATSSPTLETNLTPKINSDQILEQSDTQSIVDDAIAAAKIELESILVQHATNPTPILEFSLRQLSNHIQIMIESLSLLDFPKRFRQPRTKIFKRYLLFYMS